MLMFQQIPLCVQSYSHSLHILLYPKRNAQFFSVYALVFFNKQATQMRKELVGRKFFAFLHPKKLKLANINVYINFNFHTLENSKN